MLHSISSRELTEWRAYYEMEPFGEERQDLRFATWMALYANSQRDPKKRRRPYKPEEFMPKFERRRETGWEQQLAMVEMLNRAFGGRDLRKERHVDAGNTDG